jgi:hypothetical protein
MPTHPNADDKLAGGQWLQDVIATSRLIDQLPRSMTTLPLFALAVGDVGEPWEVTVTLTPSDQATHDALHPTATQLCAAAQHALGLAAIDSIIEPTRGTVRVRAADEIQLRLVGLSALWWVANTLPPLLRTFLDRLVVEVEQRQRG